MEDFNEEMIDDSFDYDNYIDYCYDNYKDDMLVKELEREMEEENYE